jgi:hydrogenase maturation protein HypF
MSRSPEGDFPTDLAVSTQAGHVRAAHIKIRGVVQGVGFRPFAYRLARAHGVAGWVLNGEGGVEVHAEGPAAALREFIESLDAEAPPAAHIAGVEVQEAEPRGYREFTIRESRSRGAPTVRIAPDLPVCEACLAELFDPDDRRFRYPYINCTDCGPRYSIILGLPYDRPRTTMTAWPMCPACGAEYQDPGDRRFHAQPVACPACGPGYALVPGRDVASAIRAGASDARAADSDRALVEAARLLREGLIVAVKGLGGYHLACDARNVRTVRALRQRKYRKEQPFALMARDLETAGSLAVLSPDAVALLMSRARPIVLVPARTVLDGVAPDNADVGIMLPYTPLHHLLFASGAPDVLVMTSANRSSEPIAYRDDEALDRLSGMADAFLVGERPIARRVDDSVVRAGPLGPMVLRRARGYAPEAIATLPREPSGPLPAGRPILAVGADLKNTITLAVRGEAFASQHIGDLDHTQALTAFRETIRDLCAIYEVGMRDLVVVHDLHPEYASTLHAQTLPGERVAVQHHRAHVASVLAERGEWERRVVGIALDGTGYGDDGTIWGGEIFAGGLGDGLTRVAHLRPAVLPGGDAAARFPVQAAAGFVDQLARVPDLEARPFGFPARYRQARELVRRGVRTFPTTSMGRLFDAVAALLGFTRAITFEGQAAIWLEHLARPVVDAGVCPFPFERGELDFRPLLDAVIADRCAGRDAAEIARAFHEAVARGLRDAAVYLCDAHATRTVVLSGGVFQNVLLLRRIAALLQERNLEVWVNHRVPPNDGGISLGQAALAACAGSRPGPRAPFCAGLSGDRTDNTQA